MTPDGDVTNGDESVFDGHDDFPDTGEQPAPPPPPPKDEDEAFDDTAGFDLDPSEPDTDTELEPEFKQELGINEQIPAGGPPTEEYTPAELASVQEGAEEHPADVTEVQPPTDEADEVEAEEPAEDQGEDEDEEPLEEDEPLEDDEPPGEDEPEADEAEDFEVADDQQATQVVQPFGAAVSPAQGGVPAGMEPPPDYTPVADGPDEKPPRPHLVMRFIAASLVVVATFAAATSISLLNYLSDIASALGHSAQLTGVRQQLESVNGGKPQTLLIIGSDRRYEEKGRGRSDTTILLRLDPGRDAISLLSIPRDLKVQIPGYGTDKFNAAFSFGGPRLTLKVVKNLTGLNVNHLVNVDFAGFFYAINAIGCVFVDVDHRYYHSNAGLAPSAQYAEIDIQPGYQRLCGENALRYVRYRHQDNDLVRSARQHEFLREARQKVGPSKLISDRKHLIRIFTRYTTSDIDKPETMLEVLKLFLASRNAALKEVHFPGKLGGDYVNSDPAEVRAAVRSFLGIEGSSGPRGSGEDLPSTGAEEAPPETPAGSGDPKKPKKKAKKKKPAKPKSGSSSGLTDASDSGKEQGFFAKKTLGFPVYYPTQLKSGTVFAQDPHVYAILHATGNRKYQAYKMVMKTGFGEYYGIMGTTWPNPPILKKPSETRTIKGRTYQLYYDNDRLRLVAWKTPTGSYWLNNTLLQALSEDEMLGIATSTVATKVSRKNKAKAAARGVQ